ncbi:stage III sporulation protein AH [Clostridium collagenovorans DSM 3089]|uniref:Stage III sporulation protein AH n=1 Tax=Clostridium collagenovorans DSM 3089 TaxID=1121306 RepID=A0A1M5T4C0_9CLOT|nr:SpoIIIAH-like family protein [Clostridium collagenovorans]SHH45460.1 stage III sporulation protein AH [Clostridium collagenovorans DSM 3089]
MNRKQTGIIGTLLILIVFCGFLATKLNSPLYSGNEIASGEDKSTIGLNQSDSNSFFVEAKLARDQNNAKTYQRLQERIDDESSAQEERDKASTEYRQLALTTEKEIDIETKLKGRGYEDVVCYIDGNKVKVFIKTEAELTEAQAKEIKDEVLSSTQIKDVEITVKKQ